MPTNHLDWAPDAFALLARYLDDIVEAHRRVDSGHKVGNIVVRP